MTATVSDLVERLRVRTVSVRRRNLAGERVEPDPLCVEAADRIEALEKP